MTIQKPEPRPRRFAVIGAGGAAGLATLKVVSQELRDYIRAGECELIGFEQRQDLGGVWLPDPNPVPSARKPWPDTPQYESLTTNVPHPIMFYPSHLAPPATPLFTGPHVVQDYMHSYASRFDLYQYISFNSRVAAATWDHSLSQWRVVYEKRDNLNGTSRVSYFDNLLIANGHYKHPFTPDITGIDAWASSDSRTHTHSIWYRNREPYRGRQVLIIGGGSSGIDISNEISTVAKKTVHSVRPRGDGDFEHIIQRGAISHFSSDGFVHFVNGKKEYVDRIIFATGYQYDCSFLTQLPTHEPHLSSDHLYNSSFHIYPLALHMFPLKAAFPPSSLAFIGIPIGITVFTLVEAQATLAIRQMTGGVSLDFQHELNEVIKRNEQFRKDHGDSALDVARATHRLFSGSPGASGYDFVDLIWEKAWDIARIPGWKRELAPLGYIMRTEWRELERLGLAKSWVDGVGKRGIQDWIDLMRRVVKRSEEKQHRERVHFE
ncbi:flavin-containing monooxygenase/FMO family protein [Ceratobasidium sp. AG-Ba]|nr:flavin-containing monooxygenase/FMO family protein [Ceratobasidium sp. AG-Ba]